MKDWKPENKHVYAEVDRRYFAYGFNHDITRKPETKRWDKTRSTNWLLDHPINWKDDVNTDAALDVAFVRQEIARRKAILMGVVADC